MMKNRAFFFCILSLVCTILVTDCRKKTSPPKTAWDYYFLGVDLYNQGHYEEAVDAYQEAIRLKPDYIQAYLNLGSTYHEIGHKQREIEVYKEALSVKPDSVKAYEHLGDAYYLLGRPQDAFNAYKEVIRINPYYSSAYNGLFLLCLEQSRYYEEAVVIYQEVARNYPDNDFIYSLLGSAYEELGRFTEAVEAYREDLRRNPDSKTAKPNLVKMEQFLACEQAALNQPDNADAHYNLGVAYLSLDDIESALEEYKILNDLDKERAKELLDIINK